MKCYTPTLIEEKRGTQSLVLGSDISIVLSLLNTPIPRSGPTWPMESDTLGTATSSLLQ